MLKSLTFRRKEEKKEKKQKNDEVVPGNQGDEVAAFFYTFDQ